MIRGIEVTNINVKYDVGDIFFRPEGFDWDATQQKYRQFKVVKYILRSISISCNSKKEWKTSYRVQRVVNKKIIDYGFNFTENNVGKTVFLNLEAAEEKAKEMETAE